MLPFCLSLLVSSCGRDGPLPQPTTDSPCLTLLPSSSSEQAITPVYPPAVFVTLEDGPQTHYVCEEPPATVSCVSKLSAGCAVHHQGTVDDDSRFALVLEADTQGIRVEVEDVFLVDTTCGDGVLQVESAPARINAGSSEAVTLLFSPTTAGACEATLSVTTDASNMAQASNPSSDDRVLQVRIVATAE